MQDLGISLQVVLHVTRRCSTGRSRDTENEGQADCQKYSQKSTSVVYRQHAERLSAPRKAAW